MSWSQGDCSIGVCKKDRGGLPKFCPATSPFASCGTSFGLPTQSGRAPTRKMDAAPGRSECSLYLPVLAADPRTAVTPCSRVVGVTE
eukprot:83939-Hanusia_phi.AAC.7